MFKWAFCLALVWSQSYHTSWLGLWASTSRCRHRRRWMQREETVSWVGLQFPWVWNWTAEPHHWTELRSRFGRPRVPWEETGLEHKAGSQMVLCYGSKSISHLVHKHSATIQFKNFIILQDQYLWGKFFSHLSFLLMAFCFLIPL